MEENKSKAGRKALPDHKKKRTRYFMANDGEWAKLLDQSDKAGCRSVGEYIVTKLKLDRD